MKFQTPTAALLLSLLSNTVAADVCSAAYVDTLIPAPANCTDATRTLKGDSVTVDYKGTFTNGTIFDQSFGSPDGPLTFNYGVGEVIPGFDQGLADMCVGERRWVMIPPEFGYGVKGVPGAIPPNSTLIFEILLEGIKRNTTYPAAAPSNRKREIRTQDNLVILEQKGSWY